MKHVRILVVAPAPSLAFVLSQWLLPKYDVLTVTNYPAAKAQLDFHPDAVIAPVRLGDFNGLQLALHASAMQIPSIVLDVDDPVLQQDARQLGVTFLSSSDVSCERLLDALAAAIAVGDDHAPAGGLSWATFGDTGLPQPPHARRLLMH